MNKTIKYRVGGLLAALALGTALVPATAGATEGFTCPVGTSTIPVPQSFAADGQPVLAGTVCVVTDTTRLAAVDTEAGWTAKVKSDGTGNNARTEVQFTQTATGDHVELRYEPGLTRIK